MKVYRQWLPCDRNSLYNFILIFMQLCTSFFHGLKMCLWFALNSAVNFCHFSTLLTVIFQFFAGATSISPKLDLQISPRKKLLFAFRRGTPLARNNIFAEKNKDHLFRRGFSPRNFAEKLHDISRKPHRCFPEKLRIISRWVGKDLRFLSCGQQGL